jgi:hypothetical protein
MARGFESKDVEFQQAEIERTRRSDRPAFTPDERAAQTKRRGIELAMARVRSDLETATHPNHRRMLEEALQTLDEAYRKLLASP